jgi:hypothetical protein
LASGIPGIKQKDRLVGRRRASLWNIKQASGNPPSMYAIEFLKRSIKLKKERPLCLWHRDNGLSYAQPSTKGWAQQP